MAIKHTTKEPESQSFTVPAGRYRLRVTESKDDTSKEKGVDMFVIRLRVIKDDGTDGVSVYEYIGYWNLDSFLMAAGRHPGPNKEIEIKSDEIIGCEVSAQLKIEEYNGKKNNKVAYYIPANSDEI